jgi:hypothetical protein
MNHFLFPAQNSLELTLSSLMGKTIARIEENDPTLTTLDLAGNPVCNAKHGALIGKALANNTHLKQLILDGTLQDGDAAVEVDFFFSFLFFYVCFPSLSTPTPCIRLPMR